MINYWITILGLIGFGISLYIARKKSNPSTMVCIVGKSCAEVIQSRYGKTFGIRNEYLGMVYYLAVIILSIMFMFGEVTTFGIYTHRILIFFGIISVLFSAYLTYIQFFILKATCDYCISSAMVNLVILIIELI